MPADQAFLQTMDTFRRSFQVRHIATPELETCEPTDTVGEVVARYPNYDQIPVRKNEHIIGVLEISRATPQQKSVSSQMRPFTERLIIAAEAPLDRALEMLSIERSYLLVLSGHRINGIVTRSDLLKLPVQLYAFGIIIYLEQKIGERLKPLFSDEVLQLLGPKREGELRHTLDGRRESRIDVDSFECLSLVDKAELLFHLLLHEIPDYAAFVSDVRDIYGLRNKLAHAGNYATTVRGLQRTARLLQRAEQLVHQLSA